jgi:hypothetical protein
LSEAEEAGREEIDEEHENKGSADDSTRHQETRSNAGEKGKVKSTSTSGNGNGNGNGNRPPKSKASSSHIPAKRPHLVIG